MPLSLSEQKINKLLAEANKLFQENQLLEAIAKYNSIINIKSQNIQALMQLGKIFQQQNKFDKAIEIYQKLLKLNYKKNVSVYSGLGYCYYKKHKYNLAIKYYEKAIDLVSGRCEKKDILDIVQAIYLKSGNSKKAIEQYKQNTTAGCVVNHRHKIIYFPITKNACTLFKTMMVNQSDEREKYRASDCDIHSYASDKSNTTLVLNNFNLLNNSNYLKFAIFRNPFNRLVSAYLDKIVKQKSLEEFARNFVIDVQNKLNIECNIKRSISFQELVEYLAITEEYLINEHWRSQYTFLGLNFCKLDYVGQFEKLETTFNFFSKKFDFQIDFDMSKHHDFGSHITQYVSYNTSGKFYDVLPTELRTLNKQHNGYPEVKNFFTPKLIEKVKRRFSKDIKIYQNLFKVTIEEMI